MLATANTSRCRDDATEDTMSDGRLKAAIQITAELTAMARADGYRAGAEAMREAAARAVGPFKADRPRDHDAMMAWSVQHACAETIRSLPIPEMDR